MGIMTGLLGCCSSSTLGSRANDYVKTVATLGFWLHHSPCSLGCWTNNTLAARSLSPNQLISRSFHVDRPSHSWDTAISKFDVENSRSRSWVRSKLKVTTWVQHSVDSHPFCSMSIGHPIPELWLSKFDLENQGSRPWVRPQFKVTMWVYHPINWHPFHSMSIAPPIPEIQHFQNLILKIQGQGQMIMMLHNYSLDKSMKV